MSSEKRQIVFVSGLSGAGMSSVLKNLEDFGFEVFDNIPLFLVDQILDHDAGKTVHKPVAFGLDSRTRSFAPADILDKINQLSLRTEMAVSLCYVSCADEVIQNRYSTTRRPHPLAREQSVLDGIELEKKWLAPLKENADLTIDTTDLSVHDLKRLLATRFSDSRTHGSVFVTLMSFGFKNGLPREADMVLDVRFLENPHWEKNLRPLTGREEKVQEFIRRDEAFDPFIEKLQSLLELTLPRYEVEGKSYFTIAVGCTGGKHRSVFVAEKLTSFITDLGFPVSLRHRDMR